ncbi:MAG: hypothetical protein KC414_13075, partial [Romboutsia sp.]|nr:hypothetical protein [Romboutsia sp.]
MIFCLTKNTFSHNYSITTKNNRSIYIPFELHNGIIVVKPIINNKTYNFIFDSGSKNTIFVKPKLIDSTDLVFKSNLYISGLGAYDSIQMVKIHQCNLQLNGLQNDSLSVLSLTEDVLQLDDFFGVDIDGVFGAEIFANFYMHINYKKKLIELRNKNFSVNESYYKQSVDIKNDKAYVETVIINENGQPFIVRLLLDSG